MQHPQELRCSPKLTVLRVVPSAAVAAYVLDLLPDVTVDGEGHGAVVVVVVVLLLLVVVVVVGGEENKHDTLGGGY